MDLTAAPRRDRQAGSDRFRWRLVDRVVAWYGIAVAILALTRFQQLGVPGVLAAHLALPALAWLAVHAPATPLSRVLRGVYPILLIIGLYSAIEVMNGYGAARTWDHQLQTLEQSIFGMQPSRDWWREHPSPFWSATLHLAYLSYYVVVATPLITFLAMRRSDLVERYLNGLVATYLLCYLCFLVAPVAGPYYQFPQPSGAFVANLPARIVYSILRGGSAFGAAFPSSHVAATVAATVGAWRGSHRLGIALAVPTAFLAVAVVYCQMHYVTDSVAGLLLGVVVAGSLTSQRYLSSDSPPE